MPAELEVSENEQVARLLEEVEAIHVVRMTNVGNELLELAFDIGDAITRSPLYAKYGKGNRKIIRLVAQKIKKSETRVYQFVEMKERWGDVSTCIKTLSNTLGKSFIFLSDAIRELQPPSEDRERKCKKCELHCTS